MLATTRFANPVQSDLRPTASWRHELGTDSDESRIAKPHLLSDSTYFNMYTCRNDLMHCMDRHGVYGVIMGSVTWYLCYNDGKPSLGTTQQERIDTVNLRLTAHYHDSPGISSRL